VNKLTTIDDLTDHPSYGKDPDYGLTPVRPAARKRHKRLRYNRGRIVLLVALLIATIVSFIWFRHAMPGAEAQKAGGTLLVAFCAFLFYLIYLPKRRR